MYPQNNSKISYTYEQINSFMLVSRQYIIILVTLVHECSKGHHNNYGGKSFLKHNTMTNFGIARIMIMIC